MGVLDNMLTAAATAAGPIWGQVKNDVTNFAQSLITDGVNIATKIASGELTDAEATDLYQMLGDLGDMVKNYTETAVLKAVQDAANAAIGALIKAAKAGLP